MIEVVRSWFRLHIAFLLLVLAVFGIAVVVDKAMGAYYNCEFQLSIDVTNTGTSDLTNERIQFNMTPAALVSMGIIDADADDSYLQDGSSTLDHVALGMDSTEATWTGLLTSLEGDGKKELILYMGELDPTARSQSWLSQENDWTWANDSASLDLLNSFSLKTTFTCYRNPDSGSPILSKKGSYELWYEPSVPEVQFSVWTGTGAATANAPGTPCAIGTKAEISYTSNSGSEPYQLVADSQDTTWIGVETGSPSSAESSFPTTLPEGCTTTSNVTVYYRVGFDGGSGSSEATPFVYSPSRGITYGSVQAVPSAFTTYSEAIVWSGGSDLQVGIKIDYTSGSAPLCSRLWCTVSIVEPGTKSTLSINTTLGTEEVVTAWFDGTNYFLVTSLGSDSGTPAGSNCYVNDDPVYAMMVDAKFDSLGIFTP